MFNISKSYVHLLSNALGHKCSSSSELNSSFLECDEYVDILLVYDWIVDLTIRSEDPDLGLKALHKTHPAMLGLLGYAVMSCATIGHALEQLVNYFSLISNGSYLKLELQGGSFKLSGFEIGYKAPRAFIDSGIAVILGLIKWLAPYDCIKPLAVEFVYPKPEMLDSLKSIFGENIKFSTASNALYFDREVYDYPLISASTKLNDIHTGLLKVRLQKIVNGLMSVKVKTIIVEEFSLGCIPTLQSTASILRISSRTLQYALQSEGLTFRSVFEGARKEFAHHLLHNSTHNLKYICATLGYCERSSFHKASLRWFGMTPQKYRDLIE
jgi:AraC-like DNA-binding protein